MRTYGNNWFQEGSLISDFSEGLELGIGKRKHDMALEAARVNAELASKAKSDFIANMSHELRTPLNAIIGFSELLGIDRIRANPEKSIEYVGYISQAAQHLLAVINSILDISKIQAGQLEVDLAPMDFSKILEPCILFTQTKAKEKNITITRSIQPNMPPLMADPLRLKQILINLLSNAVKFTPDGGKVHIEAAAKDARFAAITVTDTGVGMGPEEIKTALRPFGQIETGLNRSNDGTGLGLPIAQALAQMHGGKLNVSSSKGHGTKIELLIPIATL